MKFKIRKIIENEKIKLTKDLRKKLKKKIKNQKNMSYKNLSLLKLKKKE